MTLQDIRVVELAREPLRVLEQDARLVAGTGAAKDLGVLDRAQVVEGD
jgi:hypothetical protein